MVIQCENCEARFKLDDALIPEEGRKVRCSKCGQVFHVQKAPTPPQDEIHEKQTETLFDEEEEEVSSSGQEQELDFEPTVKIDLADQEELDFEEEDTFEQPLPRRPTVRPVLILLGVVIILGALLWLGWTHRARLPLLSALSEGPMDNLIIDRSELVGKFEKNGQIFVMMGSVQNASEKPRAHIKVRGMLLNGKGTILRETWAYCGNPISGADLRTKSPGEIKTQMQRLDGLRGMNKRVAPGTSIPFTIVFFERPEGVESFGAEVAAATFPESS